MKKVKEKIFFAIVILTVFFPLLVCLINSFRTTSDLIHGFLKIPNEISFENYDYIINKRQFFRYMWNSIFITFVGTAISALINPYIAYYISMNWNKKKYRILYALLSASMFIPNKLIFFPLTKMFYSLGLMNMWGLFLYYAVFMIPETVFMLVPYFRTFKSELFEAAKLDNCGPIKFYKMIFVPVCKSAIITVLILNVVWIWNDFFMPLMILNKTPSNWTLPVFIYNYLGRNSIHQGYSFASCQLALLPIVIFYVLFHKQIIKGLNFRKKD